jgi:hypothetical protein
VVQQWSATVAGAGNAQDMGKRDFAELQRAADVTEAPTS